MSDDIVARLRNEHYKFTSVPEHNALQIPATSLGRITGLWRDSADEIERLRGMVNGTANTQGDKVAKEMHHNDGV